MVRKKKVVRRKKKRSAPTNMPKKSKKKQKKFWKRVFLGLAKGFWWVIKNIGLGLWWIIKNIGKGIALIFRKSGAAEKTKKAVSKRKTSNIRVVDTIKGNYSSFWSKLQGSDSMIGLIIGARGSGKTAVAMSLLENLRDSNKKFFAMGFPNAELPKWIKNVDDMDQIENDAFIVVDEGGILFSSRSSMSNANKLLSELLFVARHKNLTIFFISQNSSSLEINTLRQADFMIFKKSSLLQKNFERKIVAKIYEDHAQGFDKHKEIKGISLVYSDDFVGFIDNDLPSFWSKGISKSFK